MSCLDSEILSTIHAALVGERLDAAEFLARRALREHPGNVELLYALGRALMLQERTETARAPINRALQIDPDHVGALRDKALLLYVDGHHEAAIVTLERLLERDPADVDSLHRLACITWQTAGPWIAEPMFQSVLGMAPDNWRARAMLGRLLHTVGRPDSAVPHLRRAVVLTSCPELIRPWLDEALFAIVEEGCSPCPTPQIAN